MSLARNIKFLRKEITGLNQTEFGKLFNTTRGQIDSYERAVVLNPPLEFIKAVAKHFKISLEVLTKKDLTTNPGLLHVGNDNNNSNCDDLLKAKDEIIDELKRQNAFLQKTIEKLTSKINVP